MVRAPRRRVRDARPRRCRCSVRDPQGATTAAVRGLAHGRGRPHPRPDRRNRHHAAALARDAHRARPEPVARRLVTDSRRALGAVCGRHDDRGARASLRVGARADHPRLPGLPPALEAPAHRDRGDQRLLRSNACARSPRAARLRGRGRGRTALRRRHDRRPHLEADARLDVVHRVWPLPGRLPGVCDRQGALSEAPDHGHSRSALRRGLGGARRRRANVARAERGHRRCRLGLRDLRRVRPRVPGLDRARRPHRRPAPQPRDGRVATANRDGDDAA